MALGDDLAAHRNARGGRGGDVGGNRRRSLFGGMQGGGSRRSGHGPTASGSSAAHRSARVEVSGSASSPSIVASRRRGAHETVGAGDVGARRLSIPSIRASSMGIHGGMQNGGHSKVQARGGWWDGTHRSGSTDRVLQVDRGGPPRAVGTAAPRQGGMGVRRGAAGMAVTRRGRPVRQRWNWRRRQ